MYKSLGNCFGGEVVFFEVIAVAADVGSAAADILNPAAVATF